MMKGGEPHFCSLDSGFLSLSLSASLSPLSLPEHPRHSPAFAHAPFSCHTQVDARGRAKAADAGQSRALERLTGHPTIHAAPPGHLEPPRAPVDAPRRPLHASRPPTCSRALLSLLQLAPERRPVRPMLVPLLWPARSSPHSSSLSLAP